MRTEGEEKGRRQDECHDVGRAAWQMTELSFYADGMRRKEFE
jgi:hypothetical protein